MKHLLLKTLAVLMFINLTLTSCEDDDSHGFRELKLTQENLTKAHLHIFCPVSIVSAKPIDITGDGTLYGSLLEVMSDCQKDFYWSFTKGSLEEYFAGFNGGTPCPGESYYSDYGPYIIDGDKITINFNGGKTVVLKNVKFYSFHKSGMGYEQYEIHFTQYNENYDTDWDYVLRTP